MQSKFLNPKPEIVVVGAAVAGASLAIRLARENFRVRLIERERFPRHKLCGEFISPECLRHFRELNVLDEMRAAGGVSISETCFYAPDGKCVAVPSRWFGGDALSLSRAEMDLRLLGEAKKIGVEVLEESSVVGVSFSGETIRAVKTKSANGETREISGDMFVDATGRANVLTKLAEREISNSKIAPSIQNPKSKIQNRLVGFKTHLENAKPEKNRCEIYFFRGGYGGLSFVENNRANHCFLVRADVVKEFAGDANRIVERVIFQNKRARETMENATPAFDWLAVSVDGFGAKNLNAATNLFAVGDAAAFIDPFTGSGMLTAFESAEILARAIAENCGAAKAIADVYKKRHREKFQNRLRVCSMIRRAAFAPNFARLAINLLSLSGRARETLARATRSER